MKLYDENIESKVWEEKLNEFLEYIVKGSFPVGIECSSPKVSYKMAQSIIWFLQEVTGIIPCEYELCAECKMIYDSGDMYYYEKNGSHYCSHCIDYAPIALCGVCGYEEVYKRRSYSNKHEMYICKECNKKMRAKNK